MHVPQPRCIAPFKLCWKYNFEKMTLTLKKFSLGGVQKVNKGEILFNFYLTSFFTRAREMAFGSFHTCSLASVFFLLVSHLRLSQQRDDTVMIFVLLLKST